MPPTTSYEFGDVLLVPFLFSDQTGSKQRPAVVISDGAAHSPHGDLIIMAITSVIRTEGGADAWLVADWAAAGLIKPSAFKPSFLSLAPSLVLRRLGSLSTSDATSLRAGLRRIFAHLLETG
jgi:mRNA interferase MazF